MRVLGLTGGIGSGKSLVASLFARLGAEVVDADQLAREVVEPGQPALAQIVESFGADILLPEGRLDRARLGQLVFADPSARARLNAITHPAILERMRQEIAARAGRDGLLVLDIPLLYESGRQNLVEKVVVVWVDRATQLERLTGRTGITAQAAQQRIDSQMPLDEKRARADYLIDNRGTTEETERQVRALYRAVTG
ncbi:MAG: dephospho-CoA kinase [Chloroflexi bacterium]|nr:MAG: dephospho-CoA kinase [Chloroflexota bacterium]TME48780.1 MAG: dephospho-CoA kinase [Chloroflexota bacterium]